MKGRRKTTGETIFFDDAFEENVKRLEEHVKDTRDTSQELIEWCDTSTVERFLRADKGNLEKAKSRVKTTLLRRRDEMMPFVSAALRTIREATTCTWSDAREMEDR